MEMRELYLVDGRWQRSEHHGCDSSTWDGEGHRPIATVDHLLR
jgi:hypothetical protein